MIDEINTYLQQPKPDYPEGFGLFCKYSRNQSLMSWFGRKQDQERLLYELGKLNSVPGISENPNSDLLKIRFGTDVVRPAIQEAPEKEEVPGFSGFRTFDDRKTRRSDLPEDLQKVYDDIASDYKLRRAYHEKMKMAAADADRARFRQSVIETQERIMAAWSRIDAFLAETAKEKVKSAFKESSCRSYISRALSAKSLSQATVDGVKVRLKALLDSGCQVSEETLARLREKGISF